jgi:choice-of-anchor B domain-containing protein
MQLAQQSGDRTYRTRSDGGPLLLGLVAVVAAMVAAATTPARATDPAFRMEEVTVPGERIRFGGKGIWGYADERGEYALIATGATLVVVDVTDPAHPVKASEVASIGADLKEVKTYQHYAYCVNQAGPLQIVDLSDPYHAFTAAGYLSERVPGAHNLWVSEDGFAYLAMQGAGRGELRILDLSDPLRPVERGAHTAPGQGGLTSCHDVYVRGDTCYASWFFGGLVVLDVSNKDFMIPMVHVRYPQQATHNAWPTPDGRFVCTTDERVGGHLLVWEMGRRDVVNLAASYMTEANAIIHNVHIKGPRAYISYYTAGVRVVDMADPRHPVEVGRFDTSRYQGSRYGGCWSVYPYTGSGLIYASDMEEGLYLLRHTGTDEGVVHGRVVVEGASEARLGGAEITFAESEVRVVSDGTGFYQARLAPGVHRVRVSRAGFVPQEALVTLEPESVLEQTWALTARPGAVEFVSEPDPPRELEDGRLLFEAQVRPHGPPVTAVTLRYRSGSGGGFRAVEVQQVSPESETYRAYLPAQLPGTLVQYYFEAADEEQNVVFVPADAPATLFAHQVGEVDWQVLLHADFEAGDDGFVVGSPNDTGVQGAWARAVVADEIPDSLLVRGLATEPTIDALPVKRAHCMLTDPGAPGEPPAEHSVTGRTTLTAPAVPLGDLLSARLRFLLWYVNGVAGSAWQDPFLVEATTDRGATWQVLAAIRAPERGWQPVEIDLGRTLDLSAGEIQVRFVVADIVSGTLLEAAVDQVRIEGTRGLGTDPGSECCAGTQVVMLRQNVPNPFNPSTTISYQLKGSRQVKLTIHDAAGHLVRRLVDSRQDVGDYAATWDGRDVRGFEAPSGVYFYRLDAEDFTDARKMLLVK